MKSKTIYLLILVTVFFISLTGCEIFNKNLGIIQLQNTRRVENNVFSSSFPEIKLQISRDLKYLGSVQLNESPEDRLSVNTDPRETIIDATSYLFGQIDQNNRIAKGVLIQMLVMHGNPSQVVPEMFANTRKNTLESGEMKILEETYQYDLYIEQELFTQKERALLVKSRVPSCFLVKQLSIRAGLGNKSRIQLLYFEDVSNTCGNRPCGACLDLKNRTAEQKQFLQEFTDRSYASTRFLKTKILEDTTSRYVDAQPKMQPTPVEQVRPAPVVIPAAPVEKAPTVIESVKADTVEKRLEALKRIYEKNLISKEDYEKKKAEILNEL
ncbi:MAG: SHOCT domain-containing protein [Deltaproteobacteria bacterium]|nr:SHOCT domain-containing protein [Deltaproteobacteria bacterium]